ncbi:hypothetical protein Asp14428_04890 [Actinoplanes sp. NBRC 14428]|nr:hypothetical protein Asp14428_04890 [Actinoplanes sp. NBRC 14428]
MRRGHWMVAAVALGALSACTSQASTGNGDSGGKVATLASGAPAPGASPTPERPRYRLDMTPEEKDRLMVPYENCLTRYGHSRVDAKKAEFAGTDLTRVDPKAGKKIRELQDCTARYFPLPEWERDPANPRAADFEHEVTKCLKAKGVTMTGDGAMAGDNVRKSLELTPACEREAAVAVK